jgi:hypothetical protein
MAGCANGNLRNFPCRSEDALLPLEQIELLLFEKRKSKTNARLGISGMQLSKVRKIAGIGGKLTKLLSSNPGFIENVTPRNLAPALARALPVLAHA